MQLNKFTSHTTWFLGPVLEVQKPQPVVDDEKNHNSPKGNGKILVSPNIVALASILFGF